MQASVPTFAFAFTLDMYHRIGFNDATLFPVTGFLTIGQRQPDAAERHTAPYLAGDAADELAARPNALARSTAVTHLNWLDMAPLDCLQKHHGYRAWSCRAAGQAVATLLRHVLHQPVS